MSPFLDTVSFIWNEPNAHFSTARTGPTMQKFYLQIATVFKAAFPDAKIEVTMTTHPVAIGSK